MNCRKNVKYLSTEEKGAIVQALLDLKDPAKAPSQIPAAQARGANSRYDDYVWLHTIVDSGAHRRPGFLAWHRKYVDLLEQDLQNVSGNSKLTLPYWDWADLAGSNPFTSNFLGGEGEGADDRVTTGAFAHAAGDWLLNVPPESEASIDPYLQRKSPFSTGVSATLPSLNDVRDMLNVTPQDESPWNDSSSTDGFRNRLEGWFDGSPVEFHNAGHVYIGGSMLPDSSPNDPVFFLHHANVDRLWAIWQQKHPAQPYVPGSAESAALNGHRLGDNMVLFGANFGTDYTIDSVLDHTAGGYMYDTDIPSVVLETPSIDFGSVPASMTTYHAVRFRLETARQVRFRITGGPSGNFSQTQVTTFTAEPDCSEPYSYGYVFIAYTAPGSAGPTENSSVTIEAYFIDVEGFYTANPSEDYLLLTETIDLFATPVAVQKTAIALALDRSGSMAGTATTSPSGTPVTKTELLKDAVSVVSALMRPEDGIGVVSYDDVVDRLLDITEMGPNTPIAIGSGREGVNTILAGSDLDPRGLTGIGEAILESNSALADGQAAATAFTPPDPYDVLAMVVMTDGNENQSPTIDDVAASISTNTFAVGLGTAGNVSEVALEKIAKNNDGDLLITGDMSSDIQEFFLTKLFIQILAGVTNQDIILDPRGHLVLDSVHRIPFEVTEADVDLDVIALSGLPALLDFCLETPDGKVIKRSDAPGQPNITFVEDRKASFYRMNLPALPSNPNGSHAGRWHAIMKFDPQRLKELLSKKNRDVFEFLRSKRKHLSYDLLVQTRSNLNLKAAASQSGHEPGATLKLSAKLTEYNQPIAARARVSAQLSRPDGTSNRLSMTEAEPGCFEAETIVSSPGVYSIRIQASGRTSYGMPFTREQVLSAAVHFGADSGNPNPGGDQDAANEQLCRLLECVMSEKVLDPRFEKRLKKLGIDLKSLRRCLKKHCHRKRYWAYQADTGPRSPRQLAPTDLEALVQIEELKDMIVKIAVDSDLLDSKVVIKRAKEQPTVAVAAARVDNIPDKDFYTKPLAKTNKKRPTRKR